MKRKDTPLTKKILDKYSIFAPHMNTEAKKSRTKYWVMFAISTVVLALLTIYEPRAFWLGLPTAAGGLAMAMDWV